MSEKKRIVFETYVDLQIIPSTIEESWDRFTVQLRVDGELTARSKDHLEGVSAEALKQMIADGTVEINLVNRAAPIDWDKVWSHYDDHHYLDLRLDDGSQQRPNIEIRYGDDKEDGDS